MLDLGLSIFFSSLIFVIFKLFDVFKVQTLYAIITNYFVACTVGLLFYSEKIVPSEIPDKPWFFGALLLGVLFILVFNLMGKTSQQLGVSVASVATKMSLVIPVLAGVLYYKEALGVYKVIGILLALVSVYFASIKEKEGKFNPKSLLLPILVFLGSGAIDVSIKYLEDNFVVENEIPLFSSGVFVSAGFVGILFIIARLKNHPFKINLKNVLGGIVLGVPNYFSIYYLIRALRNPDLTSASIFTINNVGIVLLTTLIGILLFKEKLSIKNWGGIALAVISIILMAKF